MNQYNAIGAIPKINMGRKPIPQALLREREQKRIVRKQRTSLWIKAISITVATLVIAVSYGVKDYVYLFLAAINCLMCGWNMFTLRVGDYTLSKFINLFVLIFFILANAIQYGDNNTVLTFGLTFQPEDYQGFQLLLFFILAVYNSLYVVWSKRSKRDNRIAREMYRPEPVYAFKLLGLSAIATLITLAYLEFNPTNLFIRGGMSEFLWDPYKEQSTVQTLLFDKIIRSIPVCCFIVSLLSKTKNWVRYLLFIMTLITVFPTGLPRNAAAMYWLPVIIILGEKLLKGNRLMFFIILGIFIVFPMLDMFRETSVSDVDQGGLDYLNTMNYDASQIFMATYITKTITWGEQLLGVLFFFVPRSIWLDKPVGSGHFLTSQNGADFFNVSMPYFSEGYINFGWIGVLLFTILLAWATARLDYSFWSRKAPKRWNYRCGIYLIIIGSIIFIMRGDLMSSWAYTLGTLASYTLCVLLTKHYAASKNARIAIHRAPLPSGPANSQISAEP